MEILKPKNDLALKIRQILQDEFDKKQTDTNRNFLTRFANVMADFNGEEHLMKLLENRDAYIDTFERGKKKFK
jgi:hypothetical protein